MSSPVDIFAVGISGEFKRSALRVHPHISQIRYQVYVLPYHGHVHAALMMNVTPHPR